MIKKIFYFTNDGFPKGSNRLCVDDVVIAHHNVNNHKSDLIIIKVTSL